MRIFVVFQFDHEEPTIVTGVERDVTDIILPNVGDLVRHTGSGKPFSGKVTERTFFYDVPEGINIDGKVTVTISLARVKAVKQAKYPN